MVIKWNKLLKNILEKLKRAHLPLSRLYSTTWDFHVTVWMWNVHQHLVFYCWFSLRHCSTFRICSLIEELGYWSWYYCFRTQPWYLLTLLPWTHHHRTSMPAILPSLLWWSLLLKWVKINLSSLKLLLLRCLTKAISKKKRKVDYLSNVHEIR